MRKKRIFLKILIFILIFIFGTISYSEKAYYIKRIPFNIGEKAVFEVKVLRKKVAKAELTVLGEFTYNGHKCYHIKSDIYTTKKIEKATGYSLHNTGDLYMDKETFQPMYFKQITREGTYKDVVTHKYDIDKGICVISSSKINEDKTFTWDKNYPIFNVVSGAFLVRTLNYEEVKNNPIKICYIDENELIANGDTDVKYSYIKVKKGKKLTKSTNSHKVISDSVYNSIITIADNKYKLIYDMKISFIIREWKIPLLTLDAELVSYKKGNGKNKCRNHSH